LILELIWQCGIFVLRRQQSLVTGKGKLKNHDLP